MYFLSAHDLVENPAKWVPTDDAYLEGAATVGECVGRPIDKWPEFEQVTCFDRLLE